MPSTKKQLSCRVSDETYFDVLKIVGEDDRPFRSTSEYLYTLIIRDIAERKAGVKAIEVKSIVDYLTTDAGRETICKIISEGLLRS